MESSQVVGVSSGHQKSRDTESGWTMYIGSDQICDIVEEDGNDDHHHNDHGDESDDSMASDASSGPIVSAVMIPNGVGGLGMMKSTSVDNNKNQECFLANSKKGCGEVTKKMRSERKVREKRYDHDHDHDRIHAATKADSAESQV